MAECKYKVCIRKELQSVYCTALVASFSPPWAGPSHGHCIVLVHTQPTEEETTSCTQEIRSHRKRFSSPNSKPGSCRSVYPNTAFCVTLCQSCMSSSSLDTLAAKALRWRRANSKSKANSNRQVQLSPSTYQPLRYLASWDCSTSS